MAAVTKLVVTVRLLPSERIQDVVGGLPDYCRSSFADVGDGWWRGEFVATCPVAPALVEGDLVDDVFRYFPHLLRLKQAHSGRFELVIAVGLPNPVTFELAESIVAMLAGLGARITIEAGGGA